jgi:hypothetical protein
MVEVLEIAQKLGGVSFATLLVAIIYGSYKGVWCWGYQLREAKEQGDRWQAMALRAAGLAETSLTITKQTRTP